MLKNLKLGNLVVRNHDHTDLSRTDDFVKEFVLLAKFHSEGVGKRVRLGMFTGEHVAVIRLDYEHSLVIHADPKRGHNPHFFDYNNLTGEISQVMDYECFKKIDRPGHLAYFESRMGVLHELDMSQMLRPGTMEKINELIDLLEEGEEEYEIQ